MIFMIKYQTKEDAADPHSHFTTSFFAEHSSKPTHEMVKKLVDQVSGGHFEEKTIVIEEWLGFDAEQMKRYGLRPHRFS